MEQHRLLILGLLRAQNQHGYQIMEFVERQLGNLTKLKKATVYYELKRMEEQGLVAVRIEQDEGRPPRRIYSLTERGEALFFEQLRESLRDDDPLSSATITGLIFLDALDRAEACQLLAEKVTGLRQQLALYHRAPSHGPGATLDLVIQHVSARLEMEIGWYESLTEQLHKQTANERIG